MQSLDQVLKTYRKTLAEKVGINSIDEPLLVAIAQYLGPLNYAHDASKVACSKKSELLYIKEKFLIGKLKLSDDPSLDTAIKEVCKNMGSSNRNKYRAVFYYLLVEKLGQQEIFVKKKSEAPKEISIPTSSQRDDQKTISTLTPEDIIERYALGAAGAGFIPIPLLDMLSIGTVQFKMIEALAGQYDHIVFDEQRAKSVIAALMGSISSMELGLLARIFFKGVPIIGTVLGGTAVSGFAYASTRLIGHIFNDHFKTGADLTIEAISLEKMKAAFRLGMQ